MNEFHFKFESNIGRPYTEVSESMPMVLLNIGSIKCLLPLVTIFYESLKSFYLLVGLAS